MNKFLPLEKYIELLLKDGKRSQHEDFQILFGLFGKERVTKIAKEFLELEKKKDTVNSNEQNHGTAET